MKENPYDNETFFEKYRHFPRSEKGLTTAGEWPALQKLLPDFTGKRVLDLGCGFGWHCQYAAQNGAKNILGIDISSKMLEIARQKNAYSNVIYRQTAIEDYEFPENAFDIVISSLAFHYIEDFSGLYQKIYRCLVKGGNFVFSVEHPVFRQKGNKTGGIMRPTAPNNTGRLIIISRKESAKPFFWVKMSLNIIIL